jgi:hypothetical protein
MEGDQHLYVVVNMALARVPCESPLGTAEDVTALIQRSYHISQLQRPRPTPLLIADRLAFGL